MQKITTVFKRYEKKYILDESQYKRLLELIGDRFHPDEFGRSTIMNIYFDTPENLLVNRSLDKPVYKEKLRLRTYGLPKDDTNAFVEIKKKYKGVVYKRREKMKYSEAYAYLIEGAPAPKDTQIVREINWFMTYYKKVVPAMVISYSRVAMFADENPDLRLTFDSEITWRTDELDLRKGVGGKRLLDGDYLMEIKIPGAMPVWLARALDEINAFTTSFSKYGMAYISLCGAENRYPDAFLTEKNTIKTGVEDNA